MDLGRFVVSGIWILQLLLVSDVSGNVLFKVEHKFKGKERSLSTLKAHDDRRHGRMLDAVDFSLGGNGNPSDSGLVTSFFFFDFVSLALVACFFFFFTCQFYFYFESRWPLLSSPLFFCGWFGLTGSTISAVFCFSCMCWELQLTVALLVHKINHVCMSAMHQVSWIWMQVWIKVVSCVTEWYFVS